MLVIYALLDLLRSLLFYQDVVIVRVRNVGARECVAIVDRVCSGAKGE